MSIADNIHPIWLIDEYVKILRIDTWLNPPMAPTIKDIIITIHVNIFIDIEYEININGASFWIVISNKQFINLNPSIILGNHQWKGAAPLLINKGVLIIMPVFKVIIIEFISSIITLLIIRNKRIDDAIACTIKYFSEASVV